MAVSTVFGVLLTWFPSSRTIGVFIMAATGVYVAVVVGRLIEYKRLMSSPHLDLQIHDAFIVPTAYTASCFLHVSLHNEVGPCINNRPVQAYSLQLTLKGQSYAATNSLDPENYELGIYKQLERYDEGYQEDRALPAKEQLYRISTKSVDLVPGNRVYGWVGFAIHYLPKWDEDTEYIGTRTEHDYYEEDGMLIGEGHPIEEYAHTPHSRAVASISLTVTILITSRGQQLHWGHSASVTGRF